MCFSSSWARPNPPKKLHTGTRTTASPSTALLPCSLPKPTTPPARLVQRQTTTTKKNTLNIPLPDNVAPYLKERWRISSPSFEQKERHRRQKELFEEIDFVKTLGERWAPPKPRGPPKPNQTEQTLLDEVGDVRKWMGKKDREEEIEKAVRKARSDGAEAARKEISEKEREWDRQREQRGLDSYEIGMNGRHGNVFPASGPSGNVVWHDHLPSHPHRNPYEAYCPVNYPSTRRKSSASSVYQRTLNMTKKVLAHVDGLAKDLERVGDRVKDLGWKERSDREKDDLEEELRKCRSDRERDLERYFHEKNRRGFVMDIGDNYRYGGEGRARRGRDCGCGCADDHEREGVRFSWRAQG